MWELRARVRRNDHYSWQNRLLLKLDISLMIKTIEGVYLTTGSPKWTLPQKSAPPNEHMKNVFRKWPFSHQKCDQNWPQKKLWLDIYVEKRVWAKKSAKLVIPIRSTFQNDLHPPIGGPHPVLYYKEILHSNVLLPTCPGASPTVEGGGLSLLSLAWPWISAKSQHISHLWFSILF